MAPGGQRPAWQHQRVLMWYGFPASLFLYWLPLAWSAVIAETVGDTKTANALLLSQHHCGMTRHTQKEGPSGGLQAMKTTEFNNHPSVQCG